MEAPMVSEMSLKRTRRMDERLEAERSNEIEAAYPTERYLAIAVAHDGAAHSSNGHGRQKFQELVDVLLQSESIPATLCFYTEGVRWVTRGSPFLSELQEIRRRGAEILACRACLTEAGLLDSFVVGRLDTQDHIDEVLRHAQHTMVV
jgi:hypothetical protein